MKMEIIRIETGLEGTFGTLLLDGKAFCVTLELPWRQNQRSISCIPPGTYSCQRTPSPLIDRLTGGKWKAGFVVTGVPGRSEIMIHSGNYVSNTKGCILLASSFGKLRGERAVLNTGTTFEEFMQVTRNVSAFGLQLRDVDLTPEYPV